MVAVNVDILCGNEGYMPIVVHVKEGGQIVAYGFRSDNASP
jgi:hypothetical protein